MLLRTRVLIAEDEKDINPLGLRVIVHQRDKSILCLNDSDVVLGTAPSDGTFRVFLSSDLVDGHDHVTDLLREAWERAKRGLWIYGMSGDVTVPYRPDLSDLEIEVIGDDDGG